MTIRVPWNDLEVSLNCTWTGFADFGLTLLTLDSACWLWTGLTDLGLALLMMDWPCWPWTIFYYLRLTFLTMDWPCWPSTDFADLQLTFHLNLTNQFLAGLIFFLVTMLNSVNPSLAKPTQIQLSSARPDSSFSTVRTVQYSTVKCNIIQYSTLYLVK